MKKFFPLCLLLIVAVVWTVSIAGDEGIPSTTHQPDTIQKASTIEKEKTVAQTEKIEEAVPIPQRVIVDRREGINARAGTMPAQQVPSTTNTLEESAPLKKASKIEEAVPIPQRIIVDRRKEISARAGTMPEQQTPSTANVFLESLIDNQRKMRNIKADGVISPDERAEYERLISMAEYGPPLPEPLNIVSESEPNDTCTQADPIACGDTVWCADLDFAGGDHEDWYTFTLTEPKNVTIETHPTGTDCQIAPTTDTRLFLYESDCTTLIAANDDISFPTNYFSRIVVNLIAGTYVVLTDDYWDDGSYHLSLLCDPIVPDWYCMDDPPFYVPPDNKLPGGNLDIEPNDACTDAQDVACEYAYCGDISTSTDEDWYRIVIPVGGGTQGLHVRVFGDDTPNQYAQGGGLDPWVGLYGPDCTTLIVSNDDYGGTFPDAEVFDSQLDPGGANCFLPGDTVYIAINTPWSAPGPYLLIINCVPCTIPTGACCVDTVCVATNYEVECDALGGNWYLGEVCDDMFTCAPPTCGPDVVYSNGEPIEDYGSPATQCAPDFPFGAGAADDITLTSDTDVAGVVTWTTHFPSAAGGSPDDYLGVVVTFYHDDVNTPNQPAGEPLDSTNCAHGESQPGGILQIALTVNRSLAESCILRRYRWLISNI
jgi:hypothetical protein